MKFYDRLSKGGLDLPQLSMQGTELVLVRAPTPAQGALEIRVGLFGAPAQLRLLVSETPVDRPPELVWETADLVWDAFREFWGSRVAEPSLTEVTLEATAHAPDSDSRTFLTGSVARIDPAALPHLGRDMQGFGIRFMSGPAIGVVAGGPQPALPGAALDLRAETLVTNPAQLLIAATIQWPPLNLAVQQLRLPDELRDKVQGPAIQYNLKAEKPSHYLKQSHDYVVKNLGAFLRYGAD